MIFRFTLNNTIEGSQVISNPDGWKEIKLKLERDKEYHSLVEMVELPLIFCGSDGVYDGGYDYIRNVETTQGVDAQIEILIEVSDNGGAYETFFEGLLELETIKEISDAEPYKLECNIVRNDFWSKFVNRKSQDVNLNGTTSLDGDSLTPIDDINIYLPGQRIRQVYRGKFVNGIPAFRDTGTQYLQIDAEVTEITEIQTKYNLPTSCGGSVSGDLPVALIEIAYDGIYNFSDIEIEITVSSSIGGGFGYAGSGYVKLYIKINDETPVEFTQADTINGSTEADPDFTTYTNSIVKSLVKGDNVRFYGTPQTADVDIFFNIWGLTDIGTIVKPTGSTGSFIRITGDTEYDSTQTDAFLIRDAAESILSKIIGRNNVLYSNYLGDESVSACAANYAIMKGLHIRGYSMYEKPMFMSFDDWWAGANPIFNLSLGYETIAGTEYIRIEDKSHVYDENYSITFSNVDKITRVYDRDKIFKSIEIGYEKWSAESASGVDDPQTKHTYNTRFKIIGKDERVLSKFIAASLAIEQTRRNRIEFGKDWRLDEDTIIIALSADATPFQPETDEAFTAITDLLNSDTRYNIRLTPSRNFERWKPYFNGCLQLYIPENYTFASGEGNYDMQSTGDSCDSGTLAENQDIAVTTSFYHGAGVYEFQYYMSWEDYKTVRNNRNKAIRVSNTTTDYKVCFIDSIEYDHYNSIADFRVWIKDVSTNLWILTSGIWNDSYYWIDSELWID